MIIELTEEEAETLCKVLSDYEKVLHRRVINELKRKDYRNYRGKLDFCELFLKPMHFKIKTALLQTKE